MLYTNDFFKIGTPKLNLSNKEIIELNKKYSEHMKDVRKKAKLKNCLLCGKECSSFCNSHTIPQFIMKEISNNGKYNYINTFLGVPIQRKNLGLNEAFTFHTICNECDKLYFKTYENPDNYCIEPSQNLIAEIALKNNLRMLSKRIVENFSNKEILKLSHAGSLAAINSSKTLEVNDLDISEFCDSIKLAKDTINGKKKGYYLIDYIKLNYVTKFAYQGQVAVISGFDNELINDIYSKDDKYKIQSLHISIFPIRGKTHIFVFIEDGDRRYTKFYKKFKRLSLNEKLKTLNYIILLYSEEWLLTSEIENEVLENSNLLEVLQVTSNSNPAFGSDSKSESLFKQKLLQKAVQNFSLQSIPDIPNFLEEFFD